MASRLDIQLAQLEEAAKNYQPCKGEVIVSIHIPSGPQAEIIEIQLRTITVVEVRKEQFTICQSSSNAIISDASKYVQLFCKHLPPGEWINGGHIVKPAPKALLPMDNRVTAPDKSSRKKKRRINQPPYPIDLQKPVQKTVQTFLNKIQAGLKRLMSLRKVPDLGEATNNDIFELFTTTSADRVDLESIIAKLIRIKEEKSASAASDDWKLEHLIRCIRKICRARNQLSVSEDPHGHQKEQETAASQINKVVDWLIPHAGPLALVVYSALAETRYKWTGSRSVEDVEDVVAGIRRKAIEVPEQLELFNPVVALSWILQEDYQSICQELDLANFSALGSGGANGMFKELPLERAMEQARLPNKVIQVPGKSSWLLEATDDALRDGNPKKRQRQAAVANGPCIGSDLYRFCVPTHDGDSDGLGVQNNTLDDISRPNLEDGQYHPCELCGSAMSRYIDPQIGCPCNMSLPSGGIDISHEEGYEADVIQLQICPELPSWCTIPPVNMDDIILPVDGHHTINPALIQQL